MNERWIIGQRADAMIFFGTPLLVVLLGLLAWLQPWIIVPLFWAWLLLIDGPHLFVTGLRSFLDPSRSQAEAAWRARAWWSFTIPMIAFALARLQPQWRTMDLLLSIGILYSWYHFTRQHEGMQAIYHAQTGGRGPAPERWWLRAWLWSAFALAAVATPANRILWLGELDASDAVQVAPLLNVAAVIFALITVVCVMVYLCQGLIRMREKKAMRAWWFGLLPVGAASTVTLLGIGWFEPLYAKPTHPEQYFLVVTLMIGLLHGTQYLGVVLAGNWRRYRESNATHWVAYLSRRPMVAVVLSIIISLTLYLAVNASRSSLPGMQWFDTRSPIAQFALALYWGLFFHHYYVDNKIWRVRTNPALRNELAIA